LRHPFAEAAHFLHDSKSGRGQTIMLIRNPTQQRCGDRRDYTCVWFGHLAFVL
jgi:hypothetical protein